MLSFNKPEVTILFNLKVNIRKEGAWPTITAHVGAEAEAKSQVAFVSRIVDEVRLLGQGAKVKARVRLESKWDERVVARKNTQTGEWYIPTYQDGPNKGKQIKTLVEDKYVRILEIIEVLIQGEQPSIATNGQHKIEGNLVAGRIPG